MDTFQQVGGHLDTFELIGQYKIRKLTNEKEARFYQELQSNELLQKLKDYTPIFHSMMQFQDTGKNDYYVVLENLIEPFKNPNLLDLKLGSQLYDCDAAEEKKNRMISKALKTTSGSLGLRIAGMKYHNGQSCDKEFGRQLSKEQFVEELLNFVSPVHCSVLEHTAKLKEILKSIEGKFISSSILIVYEADNPSKFTFKLIDFAHTTLSPEQGYHTDVINSLDTLLSILKNKRLYF
eukprot:NODE_369_length_9975_cov_0.256582.p4 type:complete len:236 gc:universal NODE_369_length_9975_cov_0.256582:4758-4051(-)